MLSITYCSHAIDHEARCYVTFKLVAFLDHNCKVTVPVTIVEKGVVGY